MRVLRFEGFKNSQWHNIKKYLPSILALAKAMSLFRPQKAECGKCAVCHRVCQMLDSKTVSRED